MHELEKENLVLRNRADEVTHKSKVEMTNLKMDMLKERGNLERERDKFRNEIEGIPYGTHSSFCKKVYLIQHDYV